MANTAFTGLNPVSSNIPFANGSNQQLSPVGFDNFFHSMFYKPEWDSIIHKRFNLAPFTYLLDKKLTEEALATTDNFYWSEFGHFERYQTAESVTVAGSEAEVTIPSDEQQLFGVGSVVMSPSQRQYRVDAYVGSSYGGTYTFITVDGGAAAEEDWGTVDGESFVGGQAWHLSDLGNPCGELVKGNIPFPDKFVAWSTIIQTTQNWCADEADKLVWIGDNYYYHVSQENMISEHQRQKEKQIMFYEGNSNNTVNSTPGVIPQLLNFGTSLSFVGSITDQVLLDYDAQLKTNGGGQGEYLVLCTPQKLAEVSMAMKDYRVKSYDGMMKDVMAGDFSFNIESIKINGTIYHYMAYNYYSFVPNNVTNDTSIDYNSLLVYLCLSDAEGKNVVIKYNKDLISGKKENNLMSIRPGHTTASLGGGSAVLTNRCHEDQISSKFIFVLRKLTKHGLLISAGA